jgi:hypothetical protein
VNFGGLAVLSFSGSALTQMGDPTGGPMQQVVRSNSFVYVENGCPYLCGDGPISGYSFENGQVTTLPGSPYFYFGQMVIY